MRRLSLIGCLLIVNVAVAAPKKKSVDQHEHASQEEASGAFKIDKSLLENLYQTEVSDVRVETRYSAGAIEVIPQVSYLVPSSLDLNNNYFRVPYSANNASFPFVQISIATPLAAWSYLEVRGDLSVGYAFREAVYEVESKNGMKLKDVVALHWLPLSAGVRFTGRMPGVSYVKPSIGLGAGAQWLQQSGKLDGINQSFWVPFYRLTGAVTLFDQTERGEHWFGGITVGATLSRSVESAQTIRALAWNLGLTFVL